MTFNPTSKRKNGAVSSRILFWIAAYLVVAMGAGGKLKAQGDNLKLGGMRLSLTAYTGLEYNSNIGLSRQNQVDDLIAQLGIRLAGTWDISDINQLRVNLGARYDKYFNHPELDSGRNFLILSPDTELAFIVVAGNLTMRVYDSLSFQSDPGDNRFVDPNSGRMVTNILSYNRFENRIGFEGLWDFNPFWRMMFGFNRYDVLPLSGEFRELERAEHTLTVGMTHYLASNLDVGVVGSVSMNQYAIDYQKNSHGYNVGGFFRWDVTGFIQLEGGLYWVQRWFDSGGRNMDPNNTGMPTGMLGIRHVINPEFEHSVTYNRVVRLGTVSNTTEGHAVDYTVLYSGFSKSQIRVGARWLNERESGGVEPEHYDRYVLHTSLGYRLSSSLDWRLSYHYSIRDSNIDARNYDQHIINLRLSYNF